MSETLITLSGCDLVSLSASDAGGPRLRDRLSSFVEATSFLERGFCLLRAHHVREIGKVRAKNRVCRIGWLVFFRVRFDSFTEPCIATSWPRNSVISRCRVRRS